MIFKNLRKWFGSGDSRDEDPIAEVNRYLDIAAEQLRVYSVEVFRTESQWLTILEQASLLEQDMANSRAQASQALADENEALAREWLERAQEKARRHHDLKTASDKLKVIKDGLKVEYQRMSAELQAAVEKRDGLTARIRGAAAQRAAFQAFAHELGDGTIGLGSIERPITAGRS